MIRIGLRKHLRSEGVAGAGELVGVGRGGHEEELVGAGLRDVVDGAAQRVGVKHATLCAPYCPASSPKIFR
jgi:hypothetical protein